VKFDFIRDHRGTFDIDVMCATFSVTSAGFYAWLGRPDSARTLRARELSEQIRILHAETKGVYGSIKVTRELRHRNQKVSRKTVAKLMAGLGIRSKVVRKFRIRTTDSNHSNPVAPNTLNRDFGSATGPDQVWGVGITYIHTDEGVLYLAGVMDLYSQRIVGWSMDDSMTTDLVEDAFRAAFLSRKPPLGLLHHSDRGVQYTSGRYRDALQSRGVRVSMSRTGDCYDNAAVESFWGKVKTEMVYHAHFKTKEAAPAAVFEYIEVFYNRRRLHAALDYMSPEEFEANQPD